jgi:hypothetical protein
MWSVNVEVGFRDSSFPFPCHFRPPRRRLAHELEERGALGCVPLRKTFLAHRDAGGPGS